MKITLVVESFFVGPGASGFAQIVVDDNERVQTVIDKFCQSKGIPVDPEYALIDEAQVQLENEKLLSEQSIEDHSRFKLGKRRYPSNMYLFVNWFKISALATAAGLLGLISVGLILGLLRETPLKYGVVIDAGSTHTEFTTYAWPGEKFRNTGQVTEIGSCNLETRGIAEVEPENVFSYLQPCLEGVKQQVPGVHIPETHIYFGATAGMRVLMERNRTLGESVLNRTNQVLQKSGFEHADEDVTIISGEKEGLAGWISVNLLKQVLHNNETTGNASMPTIGSLDMGGASVQIAVEVPNGSRTLDTYGLTLFEKNYTVYTESFLCYGAKQALLRYRAYLLLMQANGSSEIIRSPCEPAGLSYKVRIDDVFVFPCASVVDGSALSHLRNRSFAVEGTNDLPECLGITGKLVQPEMCKLLNSSYCVSSPNFPNEVKTDKFIAYSSFGHIAYDLNMTAAGSLDVFTSRMEKLCQMNYNDLRFAHDTFKIDIPMKYLKTLCFSGQYVRQMLLDVFGFKTTKDWERIEFRTEVNKISLSWPLGLMLNATVYTPVSSSVPELDSSTATILLTVFGILFVLGLGFLYHAVRIRRETKYRHQQSAYLL